MRSLFIAAALAASLGTFATAPAFAGEGNGPSFPGLRSVSTGVTTNLSLPGAPQVISTSLLGRGIDHVQAGVPVARNGVAPTRARRMIDSVSGLYAG